MCVCVRRLTIVLQRICWKSLENAAQSATRSAYVGSPHQCRLDTDPAHLLKVSQRSPSPNTVRNTQVLMQLIYSAVYSARSYKTIRAPIPVRSTGKPASVAHTETQYSWSDCQCKRALVRLPLAKGLNLFDDETALTVWSNQNVSYFFACLRSAITIR